MKKVFEIYVKAVLVWTVFALSFETTMLVLSVVNPELETRIGNEIAWKIDGTFNQ